MNYKLLLVALALPFCFFGQGKKTVVNTSKPLPNSNRTVANPAALPGGDCGTIFTPQMMSDHYAKIAAYGNAALGHDTCIKRNLSLAFHVVLDSLGNPGVTPAQIAACVQLLNNVWRPICIQFLNCTTNFIPNYNYNDWHDLPCEATCFPNYAIPKVINIYLVNNVVVPGASGYASPFNFIVIEKGVLASTTPIHEMGHVFGLPHTFSGAGELVKRTNCYTNGDGFCDTDADCYPSGYNITYPNCTFQPGPTDGAGDYYIPPLDNYMTYFKNCRCRFTQEQYNFMARNFMQSGTFLH